MPGPIPVGNLEFETTRVTSIIRRAGFPSSRRGYQVVAAGTIRDAEAVVWQLADEIRVNETGFRGAEGKTFDTFEIAAIGLRHRAKVERSGGGVISPRHVQT